MSEARIITPVGRAEAKRYSLSGHLIHALVPITGGYVALCNEKMPCILHYNGFPHAVTCKKCLSYFPEETYDDDEADDDDD